VNEPFWIIGDPPAPLAIVLCPRGGEWLEDDLLAIKRAGIETLVSLLEPQEAQWLGVWDERFIAQHVGLEFLNHPIPDMHTPPNPTTFRTFVSGLASRLRSGEYIGVHCRGSVGRAPVTVACTLIELGWSPRAALTAISEARGCSVPQTQEQEDWVFNYKSQP
jgi:protein-tyrosine phosphatase